MKLLIVRFMATCKIANYTVGPSEEFFFDTNVWMFLFAPLAGAKQSKQKAYSKLLGQALYGTALRESVRLENRQRPGG